MNEMDKLSNSWLLDKMKDLLKYYIALQPKIREAMGEEKTGDILYMYGLHIITEIHEKTVSTVRIGECEGISPNIIHLDIHKERLGVNAIRIPATIDDSSPEASKRSLWGMLKGHKTLGEGTDCVVYVDNHIEVTGDTPTEAILKALCHQEGVEV